MYKMNQIPLRKGLQELYIGISHARLEPIESVRPTWPSDKGREYSLSIRVLLAANLYWHQVDMHPSGVSMENLSGVPQSDHVV